MTTGNARETRAARGKESGKQGEILKGRDYRVRGRAFVQRGFVLSDPLVGVASPPGARNFEIIQYAKGGGKKRRSAEKIPVRVTFINRIGSTKVCARWELEFAGDDVYKPRSDSM